MTTTNTHSQRQDKPRDDNNKSLSSLESVSTKLYSGYFYFSGDWSPSPQLRAFTQEYPDSLILWSLHSPKETTDQVLVCNLVQGEDKAELRKKLWPGKSVPARGSQRWQPCHLGPSLGHDRCFPRWLTGELLSMG